MSLINDALKKAQRERSGEHAAAPPPRANTSDPASAPVTASGFKAWPLLIGLAVVAVGFIAWRALAPSKDSGPVAVASGPAPAAPAVASPAQPAPPPGSQSAGNVAQTAGPEPTAAAPKAPAAAEPAPVAGPTRQPAATVAAAAPSAEPAAPVVTANLQPPAAREPATVQELPATTITIPGSPTGADSGPPLISLRQPDPRILAYLDAIRINGIRPSPDDPKVLMNNRVFRIEDVVDRDLNLRLKAIAPGRLTFEDSRGMSYDKGF